MLINDHLKKENISRYQLAKACGLPYGTLNDICSGKTDIGRCSGETLYKIANALGCTVDALLNERYASVLSPERIGKLIAPVAEKYRLRSVYIFGSYARKEATENSDVDILIDREGSVLHGIFGMNALINEFREALGKEVDLITLQSLDQPGTIRGNADFIENIMKERVKVYG